MTLMYHRGPYSLTHVKELDENKFSVANLDPTSFGRCGVVNLAGKNVKKYVMKLQGNLASGVSS